MSADLKLLVGAAGASRLFAGEATEQFVSEHRAGLAEALGERAVEAPGMVSLIDNNGGVVAVNSGWAMGPAISNGNAAFIEEYGEEYRYRVRRFGTDAGVALSPPDDFWTVAASVGHPITAEGAVVLWRPALGTSPSNPETRCEELWIAGINRSVPQVVATRQIELTLPEARAAGVAIGGTVDAPLLLLVGLPKPGELCAYRAVALTLPELELAWETSLNVDTDVSSQPTIRNNIATAAEPSPARLTADVLRSLSSVLTTAIGNCSGWVVAYGIRLGEVLSTSLVFEVNDSGVLTRHPDIHPRDIDALVPVIGRPSFAVLGVAGGRSRARFVNVEEITLDGPVTTVLVDLDTKVNGQSLRSNPYLQPVAIAVRGNVVFGAPEADVMVPSRAEVSELITTPPTWHQPNRHRVKERLAWLKTRSEA